MWVILKILIPLLFKGIFGKGQTKTDALERLARIDEGLKKAKDTRGDTSGIE